MKLLTTALLTLTSPAAANAWYVVHPCPLTPRGESKERKKEKTLKQALSDLPQDPLLRRLLHRRHGHRLRRRRLPGRPLHGPRPALRPLLLRVRTGLVPRRDARAGRLLRGQRIPRDRRRGRRVRV